MSHRVLVTVALLTLVWGCGPKKPAGSDQTGDTAKGQEGGSSAQSTSVEELRVELQQATEEEDPKARVQRFEALAKKFPTGSPGHQFAMQRLVHDYAFLGQIEDMERSARSIAIEDDLNGADLLNAMAYAYAEAGTNLTEAKEQVLRALNILDGQERQGPGYGSPNDDWLTRIDTYRGYYLDTLAWIDLKQGRLTVAVATLRQAAKRADLSPIRYHLGYALEKAGKKDEAAAEYARAVALGGEDVSKAESALDALGVDKKALLEKAKAAIEASRFEAVLSSAIEEGLPDFEIEDLDGHKFDRDRLSDGTVTILDFWASWCGPCKEEFPVLQKLYESYSDQGKVRFLFISVDERLGDAKKFIKEGNFTMPVAHSGDGEVALRFGIHGLPTLLVVGPDGKIRFKHIGYNPELEEILPVQIDALLEGELDTVPNKKAEAKP